MKFAIKPALFGLAAASGFGLVAAFGLPGGSPFSLPASSVQAREGMEIPAATRTAKETGSSIAIFAGGCFWGTEAVFEHMRGVTSVQSGYAGGSRQDASYNAVSSGRTKHAEAIRIVYDPALVRYDQLLRVFFSVAHNPTEKNRQGPDVGPQYRSAIFAQSAEQKSVAQAYVAQLGKSGVFTKPIVTTLESGSFYKAEDYHQNFLKNNPDHGYIVRWDKPKLSAFKAIYPGYWRSKPAP